MSEEKLNLRGHMAIRSWFTREALTRTTLFVLTGFLAGLVVALVALDTFSSGLMLAIILVFLVNGSLFVRDMNNPTGYYRRNIVGYTLWVGRSRKEPTQTLFKITPRHERVSATAFPLPYLEIPFGGWFRGEGGLIDHVSSKLASEWWSVRSLKQNIWHDGFIWLELRDHMGNRLRASDETILSVLRLCHGTPGIEGIDGVVRSLLEHVQRLREESHNAQRARRGLIEAIVEALEGIEGTKRFIKSKEAVEIKKRLARRALPLAGGGETRRVALAKHAK